MKKEVEEFEKIKNPEIRKRYEELINEIQTERFAQGAKYIYELIVEILMDKN